MRPIVVLRPEPAASATCARIAAAGGSAIARPLFTIVARPWTPPDPDAYDAIALTSANAARLGGSGLAALRALPVWAVGAATAAAAREAGFSVVHAGHGDGAALFAAMATAGVRRALWLAGEDHAPPPAAPDLDLVVVYRADPLPQAPDLPAGAVLLVHSPRAAAHLATLVPPHGRADHVVAAISPAAAAAAGIGWAERLAASRPVDAALVALAIDRACRPPDKLSR